MILGGQVHIWPYCTDLCALPDASLFLYMIEACPAVEEVLGQAHDVFRPGAPVSFACALILTSCRCMVLDSCLQAATTGTTCSPGPWPDRCALDKLLGHICHLDDQCTVRLPRKMRLNMMVC